MSEKSPFFSGGAGLSLEIRENIDDRKKKYPILAICGDCKHDCKLHGAMGLLNFICRDFK